jgi:hypothetical protein
MKEILAVASMFVIIFVVLFGSVYLLERKTCLDSYAEFQPSWGFFTNCRIVVDGKITPVDIVRELN